VQVWRNCLYYSGDKDDATYMAREVGEEFDSLFADRILAPVLQQTRHTNFSPMVSDRERERARKRAREGARERERERERERARAREREIEIERDTYRHGTLTLR